MALVIRFRMRHVPDRSGNQFVGPAGIERLDGVGEKPELRDWIPVHVTTFTASDCAISHPTVHVISLNSSHARYVTELYCPPY